MRKALTFITILVVLSGAGISLAADVVSAPDAGVVVADVVVSPEPGGGDIPAPVVPKTAEELVSGLISAVGSQNWGLVVGLGLMVLIYIVRLFWTTLPKKHVPWIALVAGLALSISVGLVEGVVWWKALLNGVAIALSSSGFWQIFKKLLPADKK